MVQLNTFHVVRALDSNGAAVSGALLYIYDEGTTDAVTTYSNAALNSANAHPVVADSAGSWGDIYVATGLYKIDVTTSGGTSLDGYPTDNIPIGDAGIADGSITTAKLADGAATTVKILDANVTTAKLADNSVTLAKTAHGTSGDVLYYGASGEPLLLGKGTDGEVLKLSSGLPAWGTDLNTAFAPETAIATTSGTTHDFTGIDSDANRITLAFSGVSLSGTDGLLIRLGTSGGLKTTGYKSRASQGSNSSSVVTNGFTLTKSADASNAFSGVIILVRVDSNTWVSAGGLDAALSSTNVDVSAGQVSLSGDLTQIRLMTDGSNTFDAGLFNIGVEASNAPSAGASTALDGCRVYQSTSTTSISNPGKIINFDAESFDTSGYHDNSTNNSRVTVPSNGFYVATAMLETTNADAYTYFALTIRLNGSTHITIDEQRYASGANIQPSNVVTTGAVSLTSGDYLECFCALVPADDAQTGEYATWLSVHKVGV